MTNQLNQMNRQQLFNLINTVSFAVDDLLLFLDVRFCFGGYGLVFRHPSG